MKAFTQGEKKIMELAPILSVQEHVSEPPIALSPARERRIDIIHALMRGRYRWAILMAVLLGVPTGWEGYRLGKAIYRSQVPIHVELSERRVMYYDEEKGELPQYESFIETQMALIQSQHVIDLAMKNPGWATTGQPAAADPTLRFMDSLNVDRKNELITVSFDDPNPLTAMVGAEAVVKAYQKLYSEEEAAAQSRRLEILQRLEKSLNDDLKGKNQQLALLTAPYGVHDIKRLTDGKYEELHTLETKLSDLDLQAAMVAPASHLSGSSALHDGMQNWTPEDFASVDTVIATLLQQESQLEEVLVAYQAEGIGENNRIMQSAKFELSYVQKAVQRRLEKLRQGSNHPSVLNKSGELNESSIPLLEEQMASVQTMKEQAEKEYKELDQVSAQTDELRTQMDEIKKRLEDTQARIEQLNVESTMSDRITFPTNGIAERPLSPYKDTRRIFAVAGGGGAGMLGFSLVLGLVLLDRRVRSANEVRVRLSIGDLLGVLPALPRNISDATQAAAAAHSVHQIRSLLQIRATRSKPCFAVTSPLSGSGKTSLNMALAFSFASTGVKTLLIDCDLVGAGLTRELNVTARKRIGRMLRGRGLLSAEQLRDALKTARAQARKIGEVLVERGLVTEAVIDECVSKQAKMSLGVVDAINGESLMNCVAPTGVENCFVLPIGTATAHHAVSLSIESVKRLIESARRHFSVVVVDSGPILGSLEASAVAAAVDGVVMLVSRGEPRALVEGCLARLRKVGAPLAGVVLNRVSNGEMVAHSGSVSRTSRDGRVSGAAPTLRVEDFEFAGDVGPIPRAVVCSAPERTTE